MRASLLVLVCALLEVVKVRLLRTAGRTIVSYLIF